MPSSGSTSHSTSARAPPSSSPCTGMSGAPSSNAARTIRSLAVSVALTQSPGALARTSRAEPNASSTTAPPAWAASRATSSRRGRSSAPSRTVTPTIAGSQRGHQRGRRAGDELTARLPVSDCERTVIEVAYDGTGLRTHEQATEVVPRPVPVGQGVEHAVETARRDITERERGRPKSAELLPRKDAARHPGDGHHRILDPFGGGRFERHAVAPRALSANCRDTLIEWRVGDHRAQRPVGVECAKRDTPVRDLARTVRGAVDRIDDHRDRRVSIARPPGLFAHHSHGRAMQDREHRGVHDHVEGVLTRPISPCATRLSRERDQHVSMRIGRGREQCEQVLGVHAVRLTRDLIRRDRRARDASTR